MPFAVPKTASLFPDPNWDIQPKTGRLAALEKFAARVNGRSGGAKLSLQVNRS
ncbi:hypothetical protein SAMN03159422_04701 [Agrobacterium fabrum]|nr:hypothetical protein At1D132_46100 [Agrobacterium fabrum]SDB73027.1 hypothetical protein SAMN03159422_04701 [Agrobacterium fabrum]